MTISQNETRIVCTKENEEKILELIRKLDFSIQNRYDREIIILELEFPNNYSSNNLKDLLYLQDSLLGLS